MYSKQRECYGYAINIWRQLWRGGILCIYFVSVNVRYHFPPAESARYLPA